ncbi:acyl-homoserine-lactone acylase [Streptomyces ambofaciens]
MSRVTRLPARTRGALASLLAGITLVGATAAPAAPAPSDGPAGSGRPVVIRYTENGVPHITAGDWRGLGYGYGYASATDNLCVLADAYLTVRAERSRHLGPDAPADNGLGVAGDNLTSDLYFQRLKDARTVEKLVAQPPPLGPEPEVRKLVDGYVRGYNRFVAATAASGADGPACRGKAWVRPITPLDVYRHFHAVTTMSGSGTMMDGITGARPPAPGEPPAEASGPSAASLKATASGLSTAVRTARKDGELGSNALATGSRGTGGEARSVLLANPHFPWHGARRFWQSHLTLPGRLDVSGASLLGFPAVLIGHNHDLAWTHTVSTAATYGLYEVPLVPGDPTRYLVDGVPERMRAHRVTVRVRAADGTEDTVERTLWDTRYGPVIGSGPGGFPLPWTTRSAHVLRDANAGNLRALNSWLGLGQARDTDDARRVLARTQGLPWVNTVAADRRGRALYADLQVVPHVTDDLAGRCSTPLGEQVFPTSGVPVLDGGRGDCAWGSDPDAVEPGILGPARLPSTERDDYVANANNSPWLTNPAAPLTDYPRVVGDQGTPRSLRTQEAVLTAERRLAGTDGMPGRGLTREAAQRLLFRDHSRAAELAGADTVRLCRAFPGGLAPSSKGPVDVSAALPRAGGMGRHLPPGQPRRPAVRTVHAQGRNSARRHLAHPVRPGRPAAHPARPGRRRPAGATGVRRGGRGTAHRRHPPRRPAGGAPVRGARRRAHPPARWPAPGRCPQRHHAPLGPGRRCHRGRDRDEFPPGHGVPRTGSAACLDPADLRPVRRPVLPAPRRPDAALLPRDMGAGTLHPGGDPALAAPADRRPDRPLGEPCPSPPSTASASTTRTPAPVNPSS